ncbi:hypothetical protein GOM71_04155 [Paenibacillus sp. NEAU-GSW1]|nr:hypothetical protein [Paenibacillus sp. NEAU-GSW1]
MAYYSEAVIANSYFIFAVMAVLFTVPVVVWFRSRYWYFPLFIPVLWVPFTIITMFIIPGLPEDDMGGGMLALYIYFLMLGAVLLGSIIGMTINGAATAWKKFGK